MLAAVRRFFSERGVLEVDTDILSSAAPIDAHIDVMQVAIMAFASAAAIFFPVLLLAIWWRRCN